MNLLVDLGIRNLLPQIFSYLGCETSLCVSKQWYDLCLKHLNIQASEDGTSFIEKLAQQGKIKVIKDLFDKRSEDITQQMCISALFQAVHNKHTEVAKFLIDSGRADPSAENSKILSIVCAEGHLEIVEALLADRRADPAASRALRLACQYGHLEIVKALIKDGRSAPWSLMLLDGFHMEVYITLLRNINFETILFFPIYIAYITYCFMDNLFSFVFKYLWRFLRI